jgi:hypothetical protein
VTVPLRMCRFYPCSKSAPNSYTCQHGGGAYCGEYRRLEAAGAKEDDPQ